MAFFETKAGSIVGSIVIAIALIGGAYYLSSGRVSSASAESTQDALKAFATQDSDSDGLPDWEEALYGTDPHNSDTQRLGMTDAEAVSKGLIKLKINSSAPSSPAPSLASTIPGPMAATSSMTAQFAQAFFNNYISTRGSQPPTADEAQKFVEGAVANLVQTQIRPDAFTESDIHVSGSGGTALRAYAAAVQTAYETHAVGAQYDELTYFQDAVQKNDASAVSTLQRIGQGYVNAASAIASAPVPQEAASQQLALVNSMARIGTTIDDLAAVQTDPIRALVALGDYAQDAAGFGKALADMNGVFAAQGVSLDATEPGGKFYFLTVKAATMAASSTTP